MSNWDYLDEVDILPKLPPNFDELRESKKWQERKEALEALLKVLTDNERLSTKASYAELIGHLQMVGFHIFRSFLQSHFTGSSKRCKHQLPSACSQMHRKIRNGITCKILFFRRTTSSRHFRKNERKEADAPRTSCRLFQ